ncbi:PAS domain-containing protein, partial [Candidatus Poribacteria bacterium]|nr:PAS domain-containing protein [Candidatus Poribacteria bacterium]
MAKSRPSEEQFDPFGDLVAAPEDRTPASGTESAAAVAAPSLDGFAGVEQAFAVLDHIRTPIMVANTDFHLVYANPMARDTLRRLEPDIQSAFGVGVDEIIGGSIHRFHRDPARIEAILRNPAALPRDATFSFGTTMLETSINRITGPQSELLGYIVSWADVSERARVQTEMSKAQSIVENAPSNIMMADLDLNIVYINPAMERSLELITDHLPVPIADV